MEISATPDSEEELSRLLAEPMEFFVSPDALDPSGNAGAGFGAAGDRGAPAAVQRPGALVTRKHSSSLTSVSHLLGSGMQPCISSHKRCGPRPRSPRDAAAAPSRLPAASVH